MSELRLKNKERRFPCAMIITFIISLSGIVLLTSDALQLNWFHITFLPSYICKLITFLCIEFFISDAMARISKKYRPISKFLLCVVSSLFVTAIIILLNNFWLFAAPVFDEASLIKFITNMCEDLLFRKGLGIYRYPIVWAVYIIFFCINNCRQKKYNYKTPNIKGAIHICQAIVVEEKKKIECTIVVTISEIQLFGKFSKQVKGKTIKFNDFRLLSTDMGKEKLGFFQKDYIEIFYSEKILRKLYFKNVVEAHNFANIIKYKQEMIRKEDEKRRLEEKKKEEERKDKIYNEAVSAMKRNNSSSYKIAFDKFTSILNWKDSKQLSARCREKLDEAYNAALILMSTNTIEDFEIAANRFREIIGWKDSQAKINVCKNKIDEIKFNEENERKQKIYDEAVTIAKHDTIITYKKAIQLLSQISDFDEYAGLINTYKNQIYEIELKDKIYNEAVSAMKRDNPLSYKIAFDKFTSILNWKNSKQLSARCREKLDEAYNAALILVSANTIEEFEMAIKKFQEIIGWKDSQEKINICKNKIDEIKLKEENERKQKSYDAAVTEAQKDTIVSYEKAIRVLSSISDWKDSSELIKKYNKRIEEIHIQEENARKEKTYSDALKIASGKTVKDQEKAIKLFTEVIDWKDAKDQIENCKRTIKQIEEAEFYNDIDKVITVSKQEADNPQKYSDNLKKASKSALDLIIRNPYFVLGISCASEQNKMLDVRDKIEKFARLKLAGGYKSTFDLKNIEKPSRDISSIQTAIVATKDITSKWLWFETDKYCSWWDKDEIFYLYEKEKDCFEYDLILACLINAMACSPSFADSKKWNIIFASIDNLFGLPTKELLKILKKHISDTTLDDEEIVSSFKDSILKPITLLFENASKEQISNFSKIKIPKIMSEAISSAIVLNVTNLCYPLDIYVKEVENNTGKTDINKLLSLINAVENSVYKNIEDYISIVGSSSTYAKRIKKKYKDAIWNATTILENNNLKNKSITYIKEIYKYCDEGDKQRLRNTYGYEELGLSEDELTPGEMNDVAIECINNGAKIKGIRLLKKAANGGDANAQSNLAFRYYNGDDGVQKDIDTAINWWKKSGNQGNPTAQHALFMFYMEEGYRQNIGEAMRWLRKSCDQNFKPSMEVFEKIVNMAKSYDYQERNAGLDLLRKMGLDV